MKYNLRQQSTKYSTVMFEKIFVFNISTKYVICMNHESGKVCPMQPALSMRLSIEVKSYKLSS